ncbi:hypothetical protein LXL04_030228 [Taraxacum kok-saghyz]
MMKILKTIQAWGGGRVWAEDTEEDNSNVDESEVDIMRPLGYVFGEHKDCGIFAMEAVEFLNRVQQVMHSNVMTPRSADVVFKIITFAIQKGLAVQLVARVFAVRFGAVYSKTADRTAYAKQMLNATCGRKGHNRYSRSLGVTEYGAETSNTSEPGFSNGIASSTIRTCNSRRLHTHSSPPEMGYLEKPRNYIGRVHQPINISFRNFIKHLVFISKQMLSSVGSQISLRKSKPAGVMKPPSCTEARGMKPPSCTESSEKER